MDSPLIGEQRASNRKVVLCTCVAVATLLSSVVYSAVRMQHLPAGSVIALETAESWHPTLMQATKNHYFTIDGLRYFMLDVGAGPDTAILLHGMPDEGATWHYQIKALVAKGYRVLVPDMLGYGKSDKPLSPELYGLDSIVKALLAQLHLLKVSNIDIVGHDWGGGTSWSLVLTEPSLFRRHVAISIGHPALFAGQMSFQNVKANWYMYLNTQTDSEKLYAANNCDFFKSMIVPTHPNKDAVCERLKTAPNGFTGMVNWDRGNEVASMYLAIQQLHGQSPYPKCKVPTLGIWSDGDTYLWEDQVKQSDQYMAAEWRYVKIRDASHWPMTEKPDEVNSAILDWFEA